MKWLLYNLTTTTQNGGVEMSVWSLGRQLHKRGHEVWIVGGQSQQPFIPEKTELKVLTFPYRPRHKFPDLGSRARKFLERLSFARHALPGSSFIKPDRVMVFKSFDLWPAAGYFHKQGSKVGYLSGGGEFFPGYARLARNMDYLAAVSKANAAQIKEATGLDFAVNHLGVDEQIFKPSAPDRKWAERCRLGEQDQVLVSAVRLVALKGIQRAIKVVNVLRHSHPHLKLLVAGDGPYASELKRLIKELDLEDKVYLVGLIDQAQLAGFYAWGKAAIFPSMGEESLGLSIAEAMACGLPVIASRLGGIPEVVGPDGVLVPPKDNKELAASVANLLADENCRQELAARGRQRILQMFSWSACVERLENGFTCARG